MNANLKSGAIGIAHMASILAEYGADPGTAHLLATLCATQFFNDEDHQREGANQVAQAFHQQPVVIESTAPKRDAARSVPERLLYPQKEAAVLLGVSTRQIGYFISRGEMKVRAIGGRRLIPIEEIRKFARVDHPFIREAK